MSRATWPDTLHGTRRNNDLEPSGSGGTGRNQQVDDPAGDQVGPHVGRGGGAMARAIGLRKKTEDWQGEAGRCAQSLLLGDIENAMWFCRTGSGGRVMIGQTFTLIGRPKLMFRLVWRGSIGGIDCVRGVALNGKFQSFRRAADVVFVEAA
jgi:hypothetical protein